MTETHTLMPNLIPWRYADCALRRVYYHDAWNNPEFGASLPGLSRPILRQMKFPTNTISIGAAKRRKDRREKRILCESVEIAGNIRPFSLLLPILCGSSPTFPFRVFPCLSVVARFFFPRNYTDMHGRERPVKCRCTLESPLRFGIPAVGG